MVPSGHGGLTPWSRHEIQEPEEYRTRAQAAELNSLSGAGTDRWTLTGFTAARQSVTDLQTVLGARELAGGGLELGQDTGSLAHQSGARHVCVGRLAGVVVLPVEAQGDVEGGQRTPWHGEYEPQGEHDALEVVAGGGGAGEVDAEGQQGFRPYGGTPLGGAPVSAARVVSS